MFIDRSFLFSVLCKRRLNTLIIQVPTISTIIARNILGPVDVNQSNALSYVRVTSRFIRESENNNAILSLNVS
jgi:hypothetical protein